MATYPLVHGIELAELFFAFVFFIVGISVLIQGTTIAPVARLLIVDMPVKERTQYPIELEPSVDTRAALKEVEITAGDHSVGKQVFNLGLPEKVLDRKSTRLNSSHVAISYAVFCLKKKI